MIAISLALTPRRVANFGASGAASGSLVPEKLSGKRYPEKIGVPVGTPEATGSTALAAVHGIAALGFTGQQVAGTYVLSVEATEEPPRPGLKFLYSSAAVEFGNVD